MRTAYLAPAHWLAAGSPSPSPDQPLQVHVTKNDLFEWFIGAPLTIVIIVLVAAAFRMVIVRLIDRVTTRAVRRSDDTRLVDARRAAHTGDMSAVLMTQRRQQRAEAIASLLKSLATITVALIAFMIALGQLDVNIGPLIASAGILGAAIGFGAQNLIKDYVSGVAMILEDQYGVGDIVDLGPAVGRVESVTLRITQVRDMSGIVWYVRNGEILRVANRSKGWMVATVDVPVGYNEDLSRVRDVAEHVASELYDDPKYSTMILERPAYAGVESVSGDAMFVRVTAKAAPEQQVAVARAIREHLKVAFDEAGIKVPVLARPASGTTGGPTDPSPA